MNTNLQWLGIYEDTISDAIETCEQAIKDVGGTVSDIDNLNDSALSTLKEIGDFGDITNSIIQSYFSSVEYYIHKYAPDVEVDYYVNGDDSHLYIDNEEVA